MRLEVLVGQEDPQIFPLSQPRIMIGTSEACEIILSADGISRKHLLIVIENDNFFVIDQGSTNGTFINEERLVPGRRSEFTSFFPIRLGDNVLLTLLSDEDSDDMDFSELNVPTKNEVTAPKIQIPIPDSDATRSLSVKDLHKARTENLVKKRNQVVAKKKGNAKNTVSRKNPDKRRSAIVKIGAVLIIVVAAYYNHVNKEPEELPVPAVTIVKKVNPNELKIEEIKNSKLIPEQDLTNAIEFYKLLGDFKCLSEIEKYLCSAIPGASQDRWGVAQKGTMLNILINGTEIIEAAKRSFPPPQYDDPAVQEHYRGELKLVIAGFLLKDILPADLDYEFLKDYNLSFGLFVEVEGEKKLEFALAGRSEAFQEAKSKMDPFHLKNPRQSGIWLLDYIKESLRYY